MGTWYERLSLSSNGGNEVPEDSHEDRLNRNGTASASSWALRIDNRQFSFALREREDLQGPPIVPCARPERPDHTYIHNVTVLILSPPLGNPHVHLETPNDTRNKGRGPFSESPIITDNVPGVLEMATPSCRRFRPTFKHVHLAGTTSCLPSRLKDPNTATSTQVRIFLGPHAPLAHPLNQVLKLDEPNRGFLSF